MKLARHARSISRGFTLVELLIVIAIIAILASMLLPALAAAKRKAATAVCLSNQKQLALGWRMFSGDHDGWIVSASQDGATANTDNFFGWRFEPSKTPGAPATPLASQGPVLFYDDYGFLKAALADYIKSADVIHCPADRRYLQGSPSWCSYAMGENLNGNKASTAPNVDYRVHKEFEIKSTSSRFLWNEECDGRSETAPNGATVIENQGTWAPYHGNITAAPPQGGDAPTPSSQFKTLAGGGASGWWDGPAAFHVSSATFNFADGHAENHKWLDVNTLAFANLSYGGKSASPYVGTPSITAPNDRDTYWVYSHYMTTINP